MEKELLWLTAGILGIVEKSGVICGTSFINLPWARLLSLPHIRANRVLPAPPHQE